jgi:hypothetical protein
MTKPRDRGLSSERLQAIWTELAAGQAPLAEELRCQIEALEEALATLSQYYEEFVIPELEGRPIGRHSAAHVRGQGGHVR